MLDSQELSDQVKAEQQSQPDKVTENFSWDPGKSLHRPTLQILGIESDFDAWIAGSVWESYFAIEQPTFIELTREFYSTFKLEVPSSFSLTAPSAITFRLLGQNYTLSVHDFNVALGLADDSNLDDDSYYNALVDFVTDFKPTEVWSQFSRDPAPFFSGSSKGAFFVLPEFVYLHRLLAYNFSGRKDSTNVCTKTELFFIWCLEEGEQINLGYWVAKQMASVAHSDKNLCLGSVITQLAINLGALDLACHDLHLAHPIDPLDISSLLSMQVIFRAPNGSYSFREPQPSTVTARAQARQAKQQKPPRAPPASAVAALSARMDSLEQSVALLHTAVTGLHAKIDAILAEFTIPFPAR